MANTDSQLHLVQTIRTALLSWVPLSHPLTGTRTLGELLGAEAVVSDGDMDEARLYIDAPPEDVVYPYGIIRLAALLTSGDDSGYQQRGEIEVQFYGWPRSADVVIAMLLTVNMGALVSAMGDLVHQAWRDYVNTAIDDTIVAQRIQIDVNPPYTEPADRDLVLKSMRLPFYSTPASLAQYSTDPRL